MGHASCAFIPGAPVQGLPFLLWLPARSGGGAADKNDFPVRADAPRYTNRRVYEQGTLIRVGRTRIGVLGYPEVGWAVDLKKGQVGHLSFM